MTKRTYELARELFGVDAENKTPAVVSAVKSAHGMLEVYGKEVRERAAKEAEIFGYHAAARRLRELPLP